MIDEYNLSYYLSMHKDPFPCIRALLSYPLCNWVNEFYLTTREYEKGLEFIEYAYSIIYANDFRISPGEYEKWDKQLIIKKLIYLDYSNDWKEFKEFFNSTLENKHYYVLYSNYAKKHIKDKYIKSADENFIEAHFICFLDKRYNIICRKLDRQKSGKKTGHLKRHHRFMLSDDEVKRRYLAIINRLNMIVNNCPSM